MTVVVDGAAGTVAPVTPPQRGRTTVTSRALNRVVCAVTAELFGVKAQAVRVDLSDRNGLLALTIRTPVRVVALNKDRQSAVVTEPANDALLQRVAEAQTTIRERVTALTGAEVSHVTIRLTGIETEEERRVA